MVGRRVVLYFSAVATMIIAATVAGEIFLVQRVVEHARRADLRFANGVSQHVATTLEEEHRFLLALLTRLPFERGERAVRDRLGHEQESMFERGGIAVFSDELSAVGAERSAGGPPPREILLPALRVARRIGMAVTSLWRGADGIPRVSLIAAMNIDSGWRAAAGNIRLDDRTFLNRFGFFFSDPDVRLQLVDAAGIALFSTMAAEQYKSVVHGTYLLDSVRQNRSTQLRCHACHEGNGGSATRQDEVATLAPVRGTTWSVLLRENPTQMRQVLTDTVATVVVLVCLVVGAFIGFYWLLARRVLRPLRQLASAAAAVSAATPARQPPASPRHELEVLAQSFDMMLSEVNTPAASVEMQTPHVDKPPPAAGSLLAGQVDAPVPGQLRESLAHTLATAVEGFRKVEMVSAIIVNVEGEVLGNPPLIVGTHDFDAESMEAALRNLGRAREWVTREDLRARGLKPDLFGDIDTFYRSELRALDVLQGHVWVGTIYPEAVRHLKPISVLITLHVKAILDRSLLANTLWHEYRQKSRMLGHLFEAEAAERKRIAQEIHDDTSQALTALLLLLGTFPIHAPPEKQALAIRTAQERVGGIIDSTNRIMKRLRPAVLDDLGLIDALHVLGEDVLTSAGIGFELESPNEDLRAPPEIEDAIFRVFQEAASNVVRHAQATQVSAGIDFVDSQIVGWFEDDGRGMQQPSAESFAERPRFGLLGMRERITQLGGSFRLSPSTNGGVRIDVAVPVRASQGVHGLFGEQPR